MQTTMERLEGNQVKVSVEVGEEELGQAVETELKRLQREALVPGFRKGKVPRQVLEARLGRRRIRAQAIEASLQDYVEDAIRDVGVEAVAPAQVEVTSGTDDGPLRFDATVEVYPEVTVAGYEGLVVTIERPEPEPDEIEAQVDRLRATSGRLEEVSRPAGVGDRVTLDITGRQDGAEIDELTMPGVVYEVGDRDLLPGFGSQLTGASAGDEIGATVEHPRLGPVELHVLVRQVRELHLPEATDAWATEASGAADLAELRAQLEGMIGSRKRMEADVRLREGALAALRDLVTVEAPPSLVQQRVGALMREMAHDLQDRGISMQSYLSLIDRSRDELVMELAARAGEDVRAHMGLRALADARGIDVEDGEVLDRIAQAEGVAIKDRKALQERLERDGRLAALRSELRESRALTWLVENVEIVDPAGAPIDRALLAPPVTEEGGSGDAVGEHAAGDGRTVAEDASSEHGGSRQAEKET